MSWGLHRKGLGSQLQQEAAILRSIVTCSDGIVGEFFSAHINAQNQFVCGKAHHMWALPLSLIFTARLPTNALVFIPQAAAMAEVRGEAEPGQVFRRPLSGFEEPPPVLLECMG